MKTIQNYHDAIMADAARRGPATRLTLQITSGTTSRASDQRVLFLGKHLALVSSENGYKQVVPLAAPRSLSDPERRALRDLGLTNLPSRIAPSALQSLVEDTLPKADAEWQARCRAHAETIREAEAARQAEATEKQRTALAVADALCTLVAAARKDGAVYHDALTALTRTGNNVLRARAGRFDVTIHVSVD